MDWLGKRVVIVGGAGFVGSNLTAKLLNAGVDEIVVIDNLLSSDPGNIPESSRVNFREGSIADESILMSIKDEYDYVFHLATFHGNQSSIHDPIADHDNNLITTLKLFNRLKDFKKIKKIVYSSAGCAVAKKTFNDAKPTNEDDPIALEMDSPYSISKIVGEFYALYFFNHYGLPTIRARFQNVYGPGEVLGAGKWRGTPATVWRNVIPTFVYKALKQESLPLENRGRATRDFIFVEDIAIGLMLCAMKGKPGDVFNLASGVETSIKVLAEKINHLTKNPTPPIYLPRRDWDRSGKRFGSTTKAFRELGFKATVDIDQGLARTIKWSKENMNRIERSIEKHSPYMEIIQPGH